MILNIRQMNMEAAKQIAKWTYEEPYSIYSMDDSEETLHELLDESYFADFDEADRLIGYFCFGKSARVPAGNSFGVYDEENQMDIGLGMRPDLCGQGQGSHFFSKGLEFARNTLSAKEFRLTVAAFNMRAIKAYQRIGFSKVDSFVRTSEHGEIEFWVMTL